MENRSPDELTRLRQFYMEKCSASFERFKKAEELMKSHRNEWGKWKNEYEKIDYELAEIDGRLKIIETRPVRKKRVEIPILTLEQIRMLAAGVGIIVELDFDEDLKEE